MTPKDDNDPLKNLVKAAGDLKAKVGEAENALLNAVSHADVEKHYVDSVSPELAKLYVRGRELSNSGKTADNPEDTKALAAYRKIHTELPASIPFYDRESLIATIDQGIVRKAKSDLGQSKARSEAGDREAPAPGSVPKKPTEATRTESTSARPDSKPNSKPNSKSENTPESKLPSPGASASTAGMNSASRASRSVPGDTAPKTRQESRTETKPDTKPETKTETKPQASSAQQSEARAAGLSKANLESKTEPGQGLKADSQSAPRGQMGAAHTESIVEKRQATAPPSHPASGALESFLSQKPTGKSDSTARADVRADQAQTGNGRRLQTSENFSDISQPSRSAPAKAGTTAGFAGVEKPTLNKESKASSSASYVPGDLLALRAPRILGQSEAVQVQGRIGKFLFINEARRVEIIKALPQETRRSIESSSVLKVFQTGRVAISRDLSVSSKSAPPGRLIESNPEVVAHPQAKAITAKSEAPGTCNETHLETHSGTHLEPPHVSSTKSGAPPATEKGRPQAVHSETSQVLQPQTRAEHSQASSHVEVSGHTEQSKASESNQVHSSDSHIGTGAKIQVDSSAHSPAAPDKRSETAKSAHLEPLDENEAAQAGDRPARRLIVEGKLVFEVSRNKDNDKTADKQTGPRTFVAPGKEFIGGAEVLLAVMALSSISRVRFDGQPPKDGLEPAQIEERIEWAVGEESRYSDENAKRSDKASSGEEEKSNANTDNKSRVLVRPTVLVGIDDTLVSIAEEVLNDGGLAWLIADLNAEHLRESYLNGKRIVRVTVRQSVQLPVYQDIIDFTRGRKRHMTAANLVTIVEDSALNKEVIEEALGGMLGLKSNSRDPLERD